MSYKNSCCSTILIVLMLVSTAYSTESLLEKYENNKKECKELHNITEDALGNIYEYDNKYDCVYACIWKDVFVDGKLDEGKLRVIVDTFIAERSKNSDIPIEHFGTFFDTIENYLAQCAKDANLKETDKCKIFGSMIRCVEDIVKKSDDNTTTVVNL